MVENEAESPTSYQRLVCHTQPEKQAKDLNLFQRKYLRQPGK